MGLGYLHYALKRQCGNRQYLIAQGLAFVSRYLDMQISTGIQCHAETARNDLARVFNLLGIPSLASGCFSKGKAARSDTSTAFNEFLSSLNTKNYSLSLKLLFSKLIL